MEFAEKFNTFSNSELLRILENPNSYQEKAVKTAKEILENRRLSADEMRMAKGELETEYQQKLQKEEQKKEIEQKVKSIGKSIFDNINPIAKEKLPTEKTIRTVSIICFILFLFNLYNEFDMIHFMFTDKDAHWDLATVVYFLPSLTLLIATVLFYKRKKAGWFLLEIFLSYSLVFGLESLIIATKWNWPIYTLLCGILLLTGLIYTISRKNVRTVFSISKHEMILSISITSVVTGFIAYLISV